MKVRLVWWLPLLCACGSGARLANDPSQDAYGAQAKIQWIWPAPITVHEVDNTRTFHPGESSTRASYRSTHPDPVSDAAEPALPVKEPLEVPSETVSATLSVGRTSTYPSSTGPALSLVGSSVPSTTVHSDPPGNGGTTRSERPMNKLALYAFIASSVGLVGSIVLGALWILVFVGFVLGIIALIQIGHRKERGRGFAIAAILLLVGWIVLVLLVLGSGL